MYRFDSFYLANKMLFINWFLWIVYSILVIIVIKYDIKQMVASAATQMRVFFDYIFHHILAQFLG